MVQRCIHAPRCAGPRCVWNWSPKTNTLSCTEAIISAAAVFQHQFSIVDIQESLVSTFLFVAQLNSFMNMICMVSLQSRCSEEPTKGPQAMCTHACMINWSISSISASLMWHHPIMPHPLLPPPPLWSELVISIQGTAAKPAGPTHTRRPNTSQSLFDASVYKHGDSQPVFFQSTLMEGLQLSVADRHLGKRDS